MSDYRGRLRSGDYEFDLRWWLVPAVLALLLLAAILVVPSVERRSLPRQAAAAQVSPEFIVDGTELPASMALPKPQAAPAEAAPAAAATAPHTEDGEVAEEDNHAATF